MSPLIRHDWLQWLQNLMIFRIAQIERIRLKIEFSSIPDDDAVQSIELGAKCDDVAVFGGCTGFDADNSKDMIAPSLQSRAHLFLDKNKARCSIMLIAY